ncbi:hypothetical protein MLD38_002042 [Melastoma candidum]|uniref:Uncharacterized protein n=1 Tax=Melastoma candidum TaxID=119954 RepID=A0ACB9SK37_9MYRT|nr:hypothetical protein MLD38_002042 [Melastoma candidum]
MPSQNLKTLTDLRLHSHRRDNATLLVTTRGSRFVAIGCGPIESFFETQFVELLLESFWGRLFTRRMGGDSGYQPQPNFEENAKEALIDLDVTDSTELWLIQWPSNLVPDFDGKEVTLKLRHNGKLGTLEGSSGKEYELVSNAAQDSDATVFVPSVSSSKIVGKISRRVSLVHYPEPEELEKQLRSSRPSIGRCSLMSRANTASTQGSRPKSDVSGPAETYKERKRELESSPSSHAWSKTKSSGHVRGQSTTTITGSVGQGGGRNSSGVSSGTPDSSHNKSSKKRKGGESEGKF